MRLGIVPPLLQVALDSGLDRAVPDRGFVGLEFSRGNHCFPGSRMVVSVRMRQGIRQTGPFLRLDQVTGCVWAMAQPDFSGLQLRHGPRILSHRLKTCFSFPPVFATLKEKQN